MTGDDLAELVRAVTLSEEAVDDLRIVEDERAGLMAFGCYVHPKLGHSVLVVHLVAGKPPVRMRVEGAHRAALIQMLGLALEHEEET